MTDKICSHCGKVHPKCKGNPAEDREIRKRYAAEDKLSKETGIPVPCLITAEVILDRFAREGLPPEQQRVVLAEKIWCAYQNGHTQGRDFQRRFQAKKAKTNA